MDEIFIGHPSGHEELLLDATTELLLNMYVAGLPISEDVGAIPAEDPSQELPDLELGPYPAELSDPNHNSRCTTSFPESHDVVSNPEQSMEPIPWSSAMSSNPENESIVEALLSTNSNSSPAPPTDYSFLGCKEKKSAVPIITPPSRRSSMQRLAVSTRPAEDLLDKILHEVLGATFIAEDVGALDFTPTERIPPRSHTGTAGSGTGAAGSGTGATSSRIERSYNHTIRRKISFDESNDVSSNQSMEPIPWSAATPSGPHLHGNEIAFILEALLSMNSNPPSAPPIDYSCLGCEEKKSAVPINTPPPSRWAPMQRLATSTSPYHLTTKTVWDVVFGRGSGPTEHNVDFLKKVIELQPKYTQKNLSYKEKRELCQEVVNWVHERGGRFLRPLKKNKHQGYIASDDDALKKVQQALRQKYGDEAKTKKEKAKLAKQAKVSQR